MSPSSNESSKKKTSGSFWDFLKNEWGRLSKISVFFPGSGELIRLILMRNPRPVGVYERGITPAFVLTISTICTMFVIYYIYNQQDELINQSSKSIRSRAECSFIQGFFCLIFYIAAYFGMYSLIYEPLEINDGNYGRIIGDIFLLLLYTASFTLITRSFTLLAMSKFLKQQKQLNQKI
ncbi:hypothetical protein F7734_14655 [Scytonema sp. UIC 10036]|uniref:hypothetical protein n=1 Tax=Scytonema sp. UIC 10036 TaxID=2304196 RepID=UPI0012DA9530|nr:hypothetical protein [Scytonema sp. UIC 10036]MUG93597.1 hypothetical protein [Scytonema sp. UIC 10036]